ncbi:TetR/AcrR family transcriptional regulator [Yinghuangia seranimata]|uniref:TetR/AcrR family transcriptional regulator n=1 Tax=Yinghuangia seranimata TaxID=408067 RepID=UPI00248B98E8|nr:TetR/AcrR family transcriptional regulator [Yinghuangia seranimata]MDI2131610.1 helix-turn-helix domain-containing protein [Yinghuangia seranimata]
MARPRVHDLGRLLDVAERLLVEHGRERFTVRALAAASGVSNGAIYHAFGSLPVVLARVWLRAAEGFLDAQQALVDAVPSDRPEAAVVAAAVAPAVFADRRPEAARMLMDISRCQVVDPDLPDELSDAMAVLDARVGELTARLAKGLWGRADPAGVDVVTLCVVDLPVAVFRRALAGPVPEAGGPLVGADLRARLEAAVRAVLALPPEQRPDLPKGPVAR